MTVSAAAPALNPTPSPAPQPAPAPTPAPAAEPVTTGSEPSLLSSAVAPAPGAGSDTPPSQPQPTPGEPPKVDPQAPKGAPEEGYKDFTLPEGLELNQTLMGEFKEFAKSKNLPQEVAQEFVDLIAKNAVTAQAEQTERLEKDYLSVRRAWADETIKELGPKWKEEMAFAAVTRDRLFSKEHIAILKETGLENNIHVIRDAIRIGKAISEDVLIPGGSTPPAGAGTAEERQAARVKQEVEAAQRAT